MNPIKQKEKELIEIYEKLSLPKKDEVLNFVKWIWKETPKKKVSLNGIWKGVEVSEEEIEEAKISVFGENLNYFPS